MKFQAAPGTADILPASARSDALTIPVESRAHTGAYRWVRGPSGPHPAPAQRHTSCVGRFAKPAAYRWVRGPSGPHPAPAQRPTSCVGRFAKPAAYLWVRGPVTAGLLTRGEERAMPQSGEPESQLA